MKILNKILGTISGIVGIMAFYLDYLVFKGMVAIGDYLAELIGTSASVGFGFTVILCILLLGVFGLITIAGCILIATGFSLFLD